MRMGDSANAGNGFAVAPTSIGVRDLIYVVRGKQVILGSDLAELYGVEIGALNRAANATRIAPPRSSSSR